MWSNFTRNFTVPNGWEDAWFSVVTPDEFSEFLYATVGSEMISIKTMGALTVPAAYRMRLNVSAAMTSVNDHSTRVENWDNRQRALLFALALWHPSETEFYDLDFDTTAQAFRIAVLHASLDWETVRSLLHEDIDASLASSLLSEE
jgi:hypothetical protein